MTRKMLAYRAVLAAAFVSLTTLAPPAALLPTAKAAACPPPGDGLQVTDIPSDTSVIDCQLVGKIVRGNGVGAKIPTLGNGVQAIGDSNIPGRSEILRVDVSPAGILAAEIVPPEPVPSSVPTVSSHNPLDQGCSDGFLPDAFATENDIHQWRLNLSNLPAGLTSTQAQTAITTAANHTETSFNDCGVADSNGYDQNFLGTTTLKSNINSTPDCVTRDSNNVRDFDPISDSSGFVAVTCIWSLLGEIQETDMTFDNDGSVVWTTSPNRIGCLIDTDLEGVALHEWGHAVGLEHPPSGHSWLTMSATIQSCDDYARTWALGEANRLNQFY